jgi:hypothetical protein
MLHLQKSLGKEVAQFQFILLHAHPYMQIEAAGMPEMPVEHWFFLNLRYFKQD